MPTPIVRFTVLANDSVWHLRADKESFRCWVSALTEQIGNSVGRDERSNTDLSLINSIHSDKSSVCSENQCENEETDDTLRQRFMQICTFRDLAVQQLCALEGRIDRLIDITSGNQLEETGERFKCERSKEEEIIIHAQKQPVVDYSQYLLIELQNEIGAFKSTSDSLLVNLNSYIDSMQRRDSIWRNRYLQLKRQSKDDSIRHSSDSSHQSEVNNEIPQTDQNSIVTLYPTEPTGTDHQYYYLVQRTIKAMFEHIQVDRQDRENLEGWNCIHTEGQMKVYRREMEVNGRTLDPLKMEHIVHGVSGYEMCWHFWSPDCRQDWDGTLESLTVVDRIGENNVICYQMHRRVWPSVQRDACILSHISSFQDSHLKPLMDGYSKHSTWIVVNQSVDHPDAPDESTGTTVRVNADIALTCETFVRGNGETREDVSTRITYVASINPGGWAPASVVRTLAKREFPKFLSNFTAYVQEKTKNSAIRFNV
ncbi:hypothetical protein ACOME3_008703 [Neoechinorhynchus agilis]